MERSGIGPTEVVTMKKYPDMTELFARKAARRKVLANLPIEEKMEIAQRLQEIAKKAPGHHVQPQANRAKIPTVRPQSRRKCVA
jgi:hypothetical protein